MQRILVTGGSGFIGTCLVDHYVRDGRRVLNLDVAPPRNPAHVPHWKCLDVLNRDRLRDAVRSFGPTVLFHMAARTDLAGTTVDDYRANTLGVSNAMLAAQGVPGLAAVVFASSMLVCALGYRPKHQEDYCPTTPYGESKVMAESIVRQAGSSVPWVLVRPTSIWGPWFGAPYRDFFSAIQRGAYLHPRGVRVRRSYGFVYNSVFILDKLARRAAGPAQGRTFYVADYEPIELRAWAEKIRIAMAAPRIRDVPLPALRVGARAGDLLRTMGVRSPPLTSFRLNNLLTEAVYDLEPTRAMCGELPFSLDEAISLTVGWMRGSAVVPRRLPGSSSDSSTLGF